MTTHFTLNQAHAGNPAGTRVTKLAKYDYGLSSDDSRAFGIQHVSVTLNENGDYPSFTVPVSKLTPE